MGEVMNVCLNNIFYVCKITNFRRIFNFMPCSKAVVLTNCKGMHANFEISEFAVILKMDTAWHFLVMYLKFTDT